MSSTASESEIGGSGIGLARAACASSTIFSLLGMVLFLEAAPGKVASCARETEERDYRHARQHAGERRHGGGHCKALGLVKSWMPIALSAAPSTPAFETSIPAATETMSAGICETMPSPRPSSGVGVGGLFEGNSFLGHADDHAADHVDEGDHDAGHRIAANEFRELRPLPRRNCFRLQLLAALAGASSSLIMPADKSASIAICLPGMASRVNRAATSAIRPEPLGDDHKVDDDQDDEDHDADDEVALHHEAAEGLDDVAGGLGTLVAVSRGSGGLLRC